MKPHILLLLIFGLFLIFLSSIFRIFFPYHLAAQNLFILGLLGIDFEFPAWAYYIFSVGTFLLFSLISFRFFPKKSFYPIIIFILSPWVYYLTVAQSFYIYLLFLLLAAIYGVVLLKNGLKKSGALIFSASTTLLIYSSLSLAIVFPLIVLNLYILKNFNLKFFRNLIILILALYIPLVVLITQKPHATDNIFQNEITIYSNPGLMGESNRLQGDSKKRGFILAAKISENKYFYMGKYTVMKFLKNIMPQAYFTQNEKLLGFSFTPPILLGFIAPFLYGAYLMFRNQKFRIYMAMLPILALPSLFSQKIIDLNRLVLIAPVAFWIISFGFIEMAKRKEKIFKFLFAIALVLIFVQSIFIIFDGVFREYARLHKYFENILFIIDKQ